MNTLDTLRDIGLADLFDIAVVSVILYWIAIGFRRTRAGYVLIGILIASGFYLTARVVGLRLVGFLFQGFFTVILVALLVIFQEELRRLFEQLAVGSLKRRGRKKATEPFAQDVEVLASTVTDLAAERIGALIVIEGQDVLSRHVHGGVELRGRLSVPLLKSLFDPHSVGHDGAVIISGNSVSQFSCHLPLSTEEEKLQGRGTRHAAALGLSERTDALCLVVSEERGSVTMVQGGELTSGDDTLRLTQAIESFYRQRAPRPNAEGRTVFYRRNLLLKVAAVLVAVLLWFFFVHESATDYRKFRVVVHHAAEPEGLAVVATKPSAVEVVVSGPRRSFYFLRPERIRLTATLSDATASAATTGIPHEATLSASDLDLPDGITFVNIIPRTVYFTLEPRRPAAAATPPAVDTGRDDRP